MLRRISSILLALIMLASTVGIVVSKHFCGSRLVDVAFFSGPDSCCPPGKKMPMKCCHNEEDVFQLDEDYSARSGLSVIGPDLALTTLSAPQAVALPRDPEAGIPHYLNCKPPLIRPDIHIWVQAFLI